MARKKRGGLGGLDDEGDKGEVLYKGRRRRKKKREGGRKEDKE